MAEKFINIKPGKFFLAEFSKIIAAVREEDGCIEYGPAVDADTDIGTQNRLGDDTVMESVADVGSFSAEQFQIMGLDLFALPNLIYLTEGKYRPPQDIAAGRLLDLFPEYECTATEFDTGAWAIYPSRSFLPRKVRVMIDFLRERLAGGADRVSGSH